MSTILITIVAVALLMAAMAVGVLFSNKRLRGSCGGVGGDDCTCTDPARLAACANRKEGSAEKLIELNRAASSPR